MGIGKFNSYTLISLLVIASGLLLLTIITVFKARKNNKTKSYSILLYAIATTTLLTVAGAIMIIYKIQFLNFHLILIANSILYIVLLPFSMVIRRKELYEIHKKESKTEKYIAKLQNMPFEESNRAQHLLITGQDLLNKTALSISGKKDISSVIYNYATAAFKDDLSADGVVLLIANGTEETFSVKSLIGNFPPPYKLPDDLVLKEERVITNFKYAEFKYGDNIFTQIAKNGEVKLIKDGSKSELLPDNGKESFLQHGSLIFFPLISNEEVIGIVAVSRSPNKPPFEKYDAKMGGNLAGYVSEIVNLSVTINEANAFAEIENIRDTAAKIQSILLPKNFKKIPYLSVSEFFLPARGMCSDYYDVLPYRGKVFMIMSEVTGKSVQAAIIMIMIRTILYLAADAEETTDAILNLINRGITEKISIDHFAGVSLVCYNYKKKQIEFIGAGSSSIMIWRKKDKKIELLQQQTDPIGIDKNSKYKSKNIPFEAGDILAMYTDGLPESLNDKGEQYGIKRLASLLAKFSEESPNDISQKIGEDVKEFIGRKTIHDDHSLLIAKEKK